MVKESHIAYGFVNGELCEVIQPDDNDKLDAGTSFFSFLEDAKKKAFRFGNAKKAAKAAKKKEPVVKDTAAQVDSFKARLETITNNAVKKV